MCTQQPAGRSRQRVISYSSLGRIPPTAVSSATTTTTSVRLRTHPYVQAVTSSTLNCFCWRRVAYRMHEGIAALTLWHHCAHSLLGMACDRTELAAEVGQVYVVSKTSPSIVEAAAADPEKFWVAKSGGILATEEVLYALGDRLGAFIMG